MLTELLQETRGKTKKLQKISVTLSRMHFGALTLMYTLRKGRDVSLKIQVPYT